MVLRSLLGRSQASGAEVDAAAVADREARLQRRYAEIMEEYADAEYFDPKPYRELSIGEAKAGRTPAVEFMSKFQQVAACDEQVEKIGYSRAADIAGCRQRLHRINDRGYQAVRACWAQERRRAQ